MGEHSYVTAVSADGRYFEDQHGAPLLVFGDSPWAGPVRWSPPQAEHYFANREAHGFNASIVSLIGSRANGGPGDDGRTADGILPFVDGDVTRWNEPYWQRLDDLVRAACAHGNTLFLYPIDGWTVSTVFRGASLEDARRFGEMVAERYARFPNIVWMTGGDHFPSDLPGRHDSPPVHDELFHEVLSGIRSKALSPSTFIRLPWVSWQAPKTVRTDMAGPNLMALFADLTTGNSDETLVLDFSSSQSDVAGAVTVSEGDKAEAVRDLLGN